MSTVTKVISESNAAARKQAANDASLRKACISAVIADVLGLPESADHLRALRAGLGRLFQPSELAAIRDHVTELRGVVSLLAEESARQKRATKAREDYVSYRDRYRTTLHEKARAATKAEMEYNACREARNRLGDLRRKHAEVSAEVLDLLK